MVDGPFHPSGPAQAPCPVCGRARQGAGLAEQAGLLDLTHDAIIVLDMDAIIRFWNRGAEQRYGWSREEAIGKDINALLRTRWPLPPSEVRARLLAEDRWEGEFIHTCRGGEEIVVASRLALQRDAEGRPLAVLEINTDITGQRRILDTLRYNEALLRKVLETLPVGVWITDDRARIILSNPAGDRIWGGTKFVGPDEFFEYKAWWFKTGEPIPPEEWALARALQRHETSTGEEIEIECFDGSHKIVLNSAAPLLDPQGTFAGAVAVNLDITALKHAERTLTQQRERLQMLHEIDQAVLAAQDPAAIAKVAAAYLRRSIGCDRTAVVVFDRPAGTMRPLVSDGPGPGLVPDGQHLSLDGWRLAPALLDGQTGFVEELAALADPGPGEQAMLGEGVRSYFAIPLVAGSETIGALVLWQSSIGRPDPESERVARQIADSVAVALHNARLVEEVREARAHLERLSRRLVELQEQERSYVAHQLYDDEGQRLTAVLVGLGMAEHGVGPDSPLGHQLRELKEAVSGILADMHGLAMDLWPGSLHRLGLPGVVQQYAGEFGREHGVVVQFEKVGSGWEQLTPEIETATFRIVQQALSNVARHAGATRVGVIVGLREDGLVAIVEDNGTGFDQAEAFRRGSLGLLAMRERARSINGALTVESVPGAGTTVFLSVPCPIMPEGYGAH